MVVVLGDEETKVDDGHWLLQPRVQCGASELGGAQSREPLDDEATCGGEFG